MVSFDDNRAVPCLDGSFFSIKYEISKNGKETLLINGKYIHSKYTPEKECEGVIFGDDVVIFVYGFGLGYHIENIAKENPGAVLFIFEPVEEIYSNANKLMQSAAYSDRVILVNKIEHYFIFETLEALFSKKFLRFKSYSNPGYRAVFPEYEILFFDTAKKAYESTVQNLMTESNFMPLWFKNVSQNIARLHSVPLLYINNNLNNDKIAVICGAGPTLDMNVDTMKRNRDKIVVFATDTALIPLKANGIVPDVVVSLDAQHYTINDFVTNQDDSITGIIDIYGYSSVVDYFKKPVFTLHTMRKSGVLEYYMNKLGLNPVTIDTGGTVSDYTVDIAVKLGFKKIFFAGYDLSFPFNTTHCKESPYYRKVLSSSNYFETVSIQMMRSISLRNPFYEDTASGEKVFTDFVMANYRSYLENYIVLKNEVLFYSSSKEAALVKNVNYEELDVLCKTLICKNNETVLGNSNLVYLDCGEIKSLIQDMIDNIYKYSVKISELINGIDWDNDLVNVDLVKYLIDSIFKDYPFIKKFSIMTEIILERKNILPDNSLYMKHISFKILQSLYYIVRTLQKIIKKSF